VTRFTTSHACHIFITLYRKSQITAFLVLEGRKLVIFKSSKSEGTRNHTDLRSRECTFFYFSRKNL